MSRNECSLPGGLSLKINTDLTCYNSHMLIELRMVEVLSGAKWHCKPCASSKIRVISCFAAFSYLWQYFSHHIDQHKARCLLANQGPKQHKCQRIWNFLMLCSCYFFVLAETEVVQGVEEHSSINWEGNVIQSKHSGFVSLLSCTGNTELYYSFIGSCFALYLQWPRLPVSNLSAKQLKHSCTFPEEDLGNRLAGTNSTPWAHASSNPPSSYRAENKILCECA